MNNIMATNAILILLVLLVGVYVGVLIDERYNSVVIFYTEYERLIILVAGEEQEEKLKSLLVECANLKKLAINNSQRLIADSLTEYINKKLELVKPAMT